ncbi:hypothetical protein CDL12_00627 [Handroanthus impetiginosus]|uniref:Phytocyanin domain-containing protein n=1 Tax=Handroanthus impetiginosus TaxID=429701 RepID=A0A2G9IA36_9LAMI|nr:hypothetical protein CDL12_00627 [Handroanthus impetiginosus]
MASRMSRLNQEYSFLVLGLLSVLLVAQKSNGFEFRVGGSGGWNVPSDPNAAMYNQWAEKNRFQIGDTLLFVYPADQDSVLHVTKGDYNNCTTTSPLDKFTDGHTLFKLNQSGPHYFISGVVEHCHKNEKLLVVVMADRNHHNNSNQTASSPSPLPSVVLTPSPAPTGEVAPSPPPPPSEVPTPSPAPAGGEMNPTSPPSQASPPPHKNAATSAIIQNLDAAFVGLVLLILAI